MAMSSSLVLCAAVIYSTLSELHSFSTSAQHQQLQAEEIQSSLSTTLNRSINFFPAISSALFASQQLAEAQSKQSGVSPVLYQGIPPVFIISAAESVLDGVSFLLPEIVLRVGTIWICVTGFLIILLIFSHQKAEKMQEKFDQSMSKSQQLKEENLILAEKLNKAISRSQLLEAEKEKLNKDLSMEIEMHGHQVKVMEKNYVKMFELKLATARTEAETYKIEAEKLLIELEELDDSNRQKEKLISNLKQTNKQEEINLEYAVSRGQLLQKENQDLLEERSKLQQDLSDMIFLDKATKLQVLAEEGRMPHKIKDVTKKLGDDERKVMPTDQHGQEGASVKVPPFEIHQSMYQISSDDIDSFMSRLDSLMNDS